MNEAVTIFGLSLETMLDEVSSEKPSKEERRAQEARERLLKKIFGEDEKSDSSGFADPALMFANK